MQVRSRGLLLTLLLGLMFLGFSVGAEVSSAATDPVRIWDYNDDERRLNSVIVVEKSTESVIGYKLDGITEIGHTWSVDDSSVCRINGTGSRISLTGLREGVTRLRLSVSASDGKVYEDHAVISVYTPVQSVYGKTTKVTAATRSAHSGTAEKKNLRANLPKGTEMNIYGRCGNYYRATVNYNFTDGLASNNAFVLVSDISIPATGLSLNKTSIQLTTGGDDRLTATVLPALTTDSKKVTYSSSNKNVAVVYSDGAVYAKNGGTAVITAKAGSVSAKCTVTVTEIKSSARRPKRTKELKWKISKKYRYSFLNDTTAFGKKYKLSNNLRELLAQKLVAAGRYDNVKSAKKDINELMRGNWSGSCYGMSITTALNKKKQINVRLYTKSKGMGNQMNKVPRPKKKKKVAHIINYYHASQWGYVDKEHSTKDTDQVKKLFKAAKAGYVQQFNIIMKEKNTDDIYAHSILLFNYSKKKSKKNWYAIECYDPSQSTGNIYVYIHKKYNRVRVEGWSDYYNIFAFSRSTDFGRYERIKIK